MPLRMGRMAPPEVRADPRIGARPVHLIGFMHTQVLERPTMNLGHYSVFSIGVRDAVCRCGHGRSVHHLLSNNAVGACVACESTQAAGNETPSGSCCHHFSE